MSAIFVSYRHVDADLTERIVERLVQCFGEQNVFKDTDRKALRGGDKFADKLIGEVNRCKLFLVTIGEQWVSLKDEAGNRRLDDDTDLLRKEIETALSAGITLIPVLLKKAEPLRRAELPDSIAELAELQAVRVRLDPDFARDMETLSALIRDRLELAEPSSPPSITPPASEPISSCPYRGLEAFRVEDVDIYFGRQDLAQEGVQAVRQCVEREHELRFLAILGASGSGKSSLAQAGILAAIQAGAIPGSATWPVVTCRVGHNPLEGLATALAAEPTIRPAVGDVGDLIDRMGEEDRRLHLVTALALARHSSDQRVVVLIDQFEETFRPGCEELKAAFIRNLLHAVREPEGRTIVLLTMRADFYAKASAYPELASALTKHQILVGPMGESHLRDAIVEPASRNRVAFEPGLVEMLIQDTKGEPGALPFLQDALTQLWELQKGGRLTVADYNAIGRLNSAIENRADELLKRLTDAEKETCRRVLLRLTQPGEGTEDTKRRVRRPELGESDEVEQVIRKLAAARLITTSGEQRDDETDKIAFVEVSHEAVIRGWPQLRQWIDAARESLRLQHQLAADVQIWIVAPHEDNLYHGTKLAVVEEHLGDRLDELTAKEREFIEASRKYRERQECEKRLAAARLRRRAWVAAAAAACALVAAVIATGYYASAQRSAIAAEESAHEAARERRFAQSQSKSLEAQEKRESDAAAATKLVQEAFLQTLEFGEPPPKTAFDAMRDIRQYNEDEAERFALSETNRSVVSLLTLDDHWLAVQSPDYQVHLCNVQEPQRATLILRGHNGGVRQLMATAQWLITMGLESDVRIWRLDTEDHDPTQHVILVASPTVRVQRLISSPDGRWLLAVSDDATFRLWDLNQIARTPAAALASGPSPLTLESPETLPSDSTAIHDIAFDPLGQWLAVTFDDETQPALWKLGDSPVFVRLQVDRTRSRRIRANAVSVRFTADGQWLSLRQPLGYSSPYYEELTRDNSLLIWNLAEIDIADKKASSPALRIETLEQAGDSRATLQRGIELPEVSSDHFVQTARSGSAKCLVTSDGHDCRVWNVESMPPQMRFELKGQVPLRISPSGRWLATHNGEAIQLVELHAEQATTEDAPESIVLKMLERPSVQLLYSPDERKLVTLSERGNVRVWQMNEETEPTSIDLKLYDTPALAVDLSPSGQSLVVQASQFTRIWDLQDLAAGPRDLPYGATGLRQILYTRNGKRVIATDGWTARMFSGVGPVAEEIMRRDFFSPRRRSWDSAHGGSLLAVSQGKKLQVWNFLQDRQPSLTAELEMDSAVLEVKFSSSSEWVCALCEDQQLRLWKMSELTQHDARLLNRDRAPVSILAFSPDNRWIAAGGLDNNVRVWPVNTTSDEAVVLTRATPGICALAISPDSLWLVARGLDDTSTLWSLKDTEPDRQSVTWAGISPSPGQLEAIPWAAPLQVARQHANATLWNDVFARITRQIVTPVSDESDAVSTAPQGFLESLQDLAGRFGPGARRAADASGATNSKELVELVSEGFKASWFPDGSEMAFGATRDSRGRYTLNGGVGIRTIDPISRQVRLLSERGKDPSVSPDGKRILCVDQAVLELFESETIWLMTGDGKDVWRLGDGTFPSWSQDGTAIYYYSRKDKKIYRQEAHEGGQRTIVFERPALEYSTVSPNETMVAYGNHDGTFRIIDVKTRRILHSFWLPQYGYLPAWCPDPKKPQVAFGGYNRADADLHVYDLKTRQLQTVASGSYTMPVWSVDGKKLAFDLRSSNTASIWSISANLLEAKPWSDKIMRLPVGDLLPEASVYRYVSDQRSTDLGETWQAASYDDSGWSTAQCEISKAGGTEVDSPAAEGGRRRARFRVSFPKSSLAPGQPVLLSIRCPGSVRVFLNAKLVLEAGETSNTPTEWITYHLLDAGQFDDAGDQHQLAFEVVAFSYGDPLKLFDCTVGRNGIATLSEILRDPDYPRPMRLAAIRALGSSRNSAEGLADAILNVFEESSDVVLKHSAIGALPGLNLKGEELTRILLSLLNKPEAAGMEDDIFKTLGQLGPGATAAVDLLENQSRKGSSSALVALLQIAPRGIDRLASEVPEDAASQVFAGLIESARKVLVRRESSQLECEWAFAAAETAGKLEKKVFETQDSLRGMEAYLPRTERRALQDFDKAREWRETLIGVAQYRLEHLAEAIAALEKAHNAHGGWPVDLAFLAMSYHKQGNVSQAQAKLTAARELIATERWAQDVESKSAVSEATLLLATTPEENIEPNAEP